MVRILKNDACHLSYLCLCFALCLREHTNIQLVWRVPFSYMRKFNFKLPFHPFQIIIRRFHYIYIYIHTHNSIHGVDLFYFTVIKSWSKLVQIEHLLGVYLGLRATPISWFFKSIYLNLFFYVLMLKIIFKNKKYTILINIIFSNT